MKKKLNILICPLEWGLGHASRMIPIALKIRNMNHNVIIAAGEEHLTLFREEITGIATVPFPGFKPGYSKYMPQYLALLFKIPNLVIQIIKEHYRLPQIINEYDIDLVISDNRFGLWNNKVRTAYLTHMPLIPFPKPFRFLEFIGVSLHSFIIRKYTFCFIPDLPGEINLTGRLSHNIRLPENVRYIGILSRFGQSGESSIPDHDPAIHYTVILSGPEPQRSIFKEKVLNLLKDEKRPVLFLEGKPGGGNRITRTGNIAFCNHLRSPEMKQTILTSENIITRAGYSTIMELVSLDKSALLVPTPGQTEQEYLAGYLSSMHWFSSIAQGNLNDRLPSNLKTEPLPGEIIDRSSVLLDEALSELLE